MIRVCAIGGATTNLSVIVIGRHNQVHIVPERAHMDRAWTPKASRGWDVGKEYPLPTWLKGEVSKRSLGEA